MEMEDGEESKFGPCKSWKFRNLSTSTPYSHSLRTFSPVDKQRRSLSTSVCSDDSGYDGSSFEVSPLVVSDSVKVCSASTSFCTPASCSRVPVIHVTQSVCSGVATVQDTPVTSDKSVSGRWLHFTPTSTTNQQSSLRFRYWSNSSHDDTLETDSAKTTLDFQPEEKKFKFDFDADLSTAFERTNICDHDDTGYQSTTTTFTQEPDTVNSITDPFLVQRFNEVLRKFTPSVPDRLIGRKVGLDDVDILSELQSRNMTGVTSGILRHLDPQDLCSMCQVSRQWRKICDSDKTAMERKRKFITKTRQKQTQGKENLKMKQSRRPDRRLAGGGVLQKLGSLQAICEEQAKPSTEVRTPRDEFQEAAKSLKNEEKLQHCPLCHKPAKVFPAQERGNCLSADCSYDYCVKCFFAFHGARACYPLGTKKQKTHSIGSKQSKKNLRRL